MASIEDLKDLNPIDEVIAETAGLQIVRKGRWWRTEEHDSLVIYPDRRRFTWNSRGWFGDVFEWLEKHQQRPFLEAAAWLARRANVDFDQGQAVDRQAHQARRRKEEALTVASRYLAGLLFQHRAALEWARGRGWSEEILQLARCGFWDGDRSALLQHFQLHEVDAESEAARAVLGMPAGLFIYPHFERGRCVYLSGRSIEGKRHYNLPRQLAGPKRVYWNHLAGGDVDSLAIVEGQADALTLALWEVPALALAGVHVTPELVATVGRFDYVYVALDGDQAGRGAAEHLAEQLGPQARIATWPEHDANDWLQAGGTAEACQELLANAPLYVEHLAAAVEAAPPMEREPARQKAVQAIARLDAVGFADRKYELAKRLGMKVTQLKSVVKAARKEQRAKEQDSRPLVQRANGLPAQYEGHLFEMILDREARGGPRAGFAVRFPDGRIEVVERLELEEQIVEPLPADLSAVKDGVRLASGLAEYGAERDLVERVRQFIHKFCDLPEEFERLSSYYVLLSYRFDSFKRVPYLRQLGDAGSGKTRWLQTMAALCFRAHYVTGGSSIAPLYRIADVFGNVTTIMDEADFNLETEHGRNLNLIFTTGYDDEGRVSRVNVDSLLPEYYSVYGPKILTQRDPFDDDATNSRCLTHESRGGLRVREDIPIMINKRDFQPQADELRRQLLLYRLRTWQPDVPIRENGINRDLPGRLLEIILPMQTLFEGDEELQRDIKRLIEEKHRQMVADRAGTLQARIVEGILLAYYDPTEEAAARDKEAAESDVERGIHPRMAMHLIAERVNEVIDRQNYGEEEEEEEDGDGQARRRKHKQVQHTTVGNHIRGRLNLRTEQDKVYRNVCLIWDEERMRGRAEVYGLADLMQELEAKVAEKARGIPGFGPME